METEKRKLHKAMVARTPSQTCSVKERKLVKTAARQNMMTRLPLSTDAPSGRSFLEAQAVSAVTRLSYEQAIAGLFAFVQKGGMKTATDVQMDSAATLFVNHLWEQGMEKHDATRFYASLLDRFPRLAGSSTRMLPRCRRALQG